MKLYQTYKKKAVLLLLFGILSLIPIVFSYAQTALDLQNKINQKDADISKLEEEIKVYQLELENLGKQKDSLSGTIKQLDVTRKKLVADINVTQTKIDKTNLKIQSLSSEIGTKEKIIKLKQIKGELEDTRKETINAKNELVLLKSKLSDQQKIVIQNTNEKNKLLKQTKNSETAYQKLLKDQLAKKEAFEKELRDYESQLKFILDP